MANYFEMKNASLKRYNTLRLEVSAETVIIPHTGVGLVEALREYKDREIIIIGNGSNMLFSKDHYDENYCFIITILLNDITIKNNEIVTESGARLHRLAWFACEQSIGGMEFCEDIPGTMGGALIMNAGQWEFNIGQYVNWIEVYNYETDMIETIRPEEGFFGYRYSRINEMPVYILRAGLKTSPGDYNKALDKILFYRHERYVKQPRNFANAGSVFKRPVDANGESLYIWKMFDEVGLRGHRIGDAMVSEKHPGFIVNVKNASVEDMAALIKECKDRCLEKFNVKIELEWRVIG